jgi:hypothetical protein
MCLTTLMLGTVVMTQQAATLVLRSGERVSGQLADMGADFTMLVNGERRHIPISEVVLIDFVGGGSAQPDSEMSKIPSPGNLTVLRDGQVMTGWLADVSGIPMQLVFHTDQGNRRINASTIDRVYLAQPSVVAAATGVTAPAPAPAGNQRSFAVPAHTQWIDTGLNVQQGQLVTFSASGQIQFSNNPADTAVPAGSTNQRYEPRAPIGTALAGALIGRIGKGLPFGIGNQTAPIGMPASGRLFLGINDSNVRDNSGQFDVTLTF